jgi:glycosyltransferase involved in cell wall biosynthesis
MKILSIVWYKVLPPRYGGQKGIAVFNKYLARHAPMTCLCSHDNQPGNDVGYKVLPLLPVSKWQFLNPFVIRRIAEVAKKEKPTHIIAEHPYHGLAARLAAIKTGAKLIIHSHNIESERFRQMGKYWWQMMGWYEGWVHRRAGLSLFKTKEDMEWAVSNYHLQPDACMLIPYGIDPEAVQPATNASEIIRKRHDLSEKEKILLFTGTLDYRPNAQAVEIIFREIAPRLAARNFSYKIIITGRIQKKNYLYLSNLHHPSVILAGEVEDIGNYFAAADVFINPVRDVAGIQTKVIDALCYHLNVVCFRPALKGIQTDCCKEKIYAAKENTLHAFCDKIMEALGAAPAPTPPGFRDAYSFVSLAEKLAARMKSL